MDIDQESVKPLIEKAKNGDKQAREALIRIHIDLANVIAKRYWSRRPQFRDEIKSAAHYAVVKTVNRVVDGDSLTENLTGSIALRVRGEIILFLTKNYVVRIPKMLFKLRMPLPKMYSLGDKDEIFANSVTPSTVDYELVCVDLRTKLALTPDELAIINLRIEGHTFEEIGEKLGCCKSNIHRILCNIRQKYIEFARINPEIALIPKELRRGETRVSHACEGV